MGVDWDQLWRRVQDRGDATLPVLGRGAKAKKLMSRLCAELPDTFVAQHSDGHYEAIVHPKAGGIGYDPWPNAR